MNDFFAVGADGVVVWFSLVFILRFIGAEVYSLDHPFRCEKVKVAVNSHEVNMGEGLVYIGSRQSTVRSFEHVEYLTSFFGESYGHMQIVCILADICYTGNCKSFAFIFYTLFS